MCETPAAAAIFSTVVASYPCSRNSRSADARMRSLVAAFLRCRQSGSGSVTGVIVAYRPAGTRPGQAAGELGGLGDGGARGGGVCGGQRAKRGLEGARVAG